MANQFHPKPPEEASSAVADAAPSPPPPAGNEVPEAEPGIHQLLDPDAACSITPSSSIEPDSYVTSLASDIRRGVEENGRVYAAYGIHKPWVPIDDLEMDRNDLQHCKFTLLMNDSLFLAPIVDFPQNILDLGTGSGIWAIDVAEQYPSALVIGVDTAPVQPSVLPPNLVFEVDDVEHDWLWAESSFDLIHGRELIMAIRDWPRLVRQAFDRLKPGGYLQLAGSYPEFQSDDGTLTPDSAYVEIGNIYFDMSERVGASGREVLNWKDYLSCAGFEDIYERLYKIPTNPWPKDERLKKVGAFELSHFCDNIANIFARGYTQILGGDPNYFQVLLARARNEVSNRRMHSWVPFYVVYGRRPDDHKASPPTI
ncbi:methyltransferase domain-containing protein [Hirsutella rhossiliensis]|uniref:Methyltransferase domain-containing protein n=1 Tax=Hirsutella rhossiliensis TaxID=111463 RepID=A0A9P8N232_9HYPO|nr:methyltransferase domain-containing protein [Hirsutella rhossiliensis]KAH0964511.1 methyltransferase domain-containing protein [Hirsutella rhossiliensis]